MKKLLFTFLVAAMGIASASAQTGVYQDEQGEYRYETRQERVWVPEQRTGGIFGVGGRTIPGHYETRSEQVKVYNNRNNNDARYNNTNEKGWAGKHPHGMPPGQRKKQQNSSYDQNNERVDRPRDRQDDENRNKPHKSKKGKKEND